MAAQAARRPRIRGKTILVYAILLWWTLMLAFPMYWLVITSIKTGLALTQKATYIPWVDFPPSLRAWHYVFIERFDWAMKPFMNSLIISLSTAVISVLLGSAAGYGLARFRYRFGPWDNHGIALWFLSQRMFPAAILIIPFLVMYRELQLLDTHLGLIIAFTGFSTPFVAWIMRDFFAALPAEIEESALIDGCSRLGVLRHVAIPLAAPGIVAAFILVMIGAWNEYLFALVLTFSEAVTIPLFLQIQTQAVQTGTQWWNMAAIALVSVLPVIIAGALLERYITRGLTFGAVK
jgi:multiple sugar transport system permease protein